MLAPAWHLLCLLNLQCDAGSALADVTPLASVPCVPLCRASRHSAVQAVHPVTVQPQQPQQAPPPPPPPPQQAPAPPLPSIPVAATQQTAEPAPTQQLETNGTVNGAPAANAAFGLQQDVLQAAVAATGREQGRDTLAGGGGLAAGLQGMEEWDLSLEQQQQRPFQPPDPSHLLRAVPVIFDLETSGEGRLVVGRREGRVRSAGTRCAVQRSAVPSCWLGTATTLLPPELARARLPPLACRTDRLPKGRVAEVGALAVGSGETFRQYVSLPPGVRMEAGAAEITGLSTEFLARHPPFEEVYPSFLAFLRRQVQAAGPGAYLLLVGHNIRGKCGPLPLLLPRARLCRGGVCAELLCRGGASPVGLTPLCAPAPGHLTSPHLTPPHLSPPHLSAVFDIKVLASQAAASGLPTLRHARFLDTVFLARALFPGSGAEGDPSLPPNKSLAGLYTFFAGRVPHKSHGALEDCDSNRLVLEQLLLRMPDVPGGVLKAHLPAGVLAVGMHVHALVLCALP